MKEMYFYPSQEEVEITDPFWTDYIENIRNITLPYSFKKFKEAGYYKNFESVGNKENLSHIGPPFTDGLLLESLRGACDMLRIRFDSALEALIEEAVKVVCSAVDADEDGFLCTATTTEYPRQRFGLNGGILLYQHDLYNMGALIEAAVSHYCATKKTHLLKRAVRTANYICSAIGEAPKSLVVPGHSLAEEAFLKLYRLFNIHRELDSFAKENNVCTDNYLELVEFWYKVRGCSKNNPPDPEFIKDRKYLLRFNKEYYQNHLPFDKQKTAVGHSVRATLCYLGAASLLREIENEEYLDSLHSIWQDITNKKLHITGGIGSRHDIEGFDREYFLPNTAYLETCAAIGLAFFNSEMALIDLDSKYFDCFELSLYNNVLGAVGDDFKHFFYQNPLYSDGTLRRWEWHDCPCCPPMLLKLFSCLNTYIYSVNREKSRLNINMLIGSNYETEEFCISQKGNTITLDSKGKEIKLSIRIPTYAKGFTLASNGKTLSYDINNGYAMLEGIFSPENTIEVGFDTAVVQIFASPEVKDDSGRVCIMHGKHIMCAEGIDNGGNIDITVAQNPDFKVSGDNVTGLDKNGNRFTLIPYYRWCNRGQTDDDFKMAVWHLKDDMPKEDSLLKALNGRLYASLESIK